MSIFNAEIRGLKELQAAIKRNPTVVLNEGKKFLVRGLAAYERGIIRDPWKIGSYSGGAPVDTRHLVQSHGKRIEGLRGVIGPDIEYKTGYSVYVHEGTSRMQARPWLDWVKMSKDAEVKTLYREFLTTIVRELSK